MPFIPSTYAQAVGQQGTGELVNTILVFGLIFLVFYFLVIRPQQKKVKQHNTMLAALRRGDRVVTAGGIIGLIIRVVNSQEAVIEIADNVRVRVVRDTIASITAKTEVISDKVKAGKSEKSDDIAGSSSTHLDAAEKNTGGRGKAFSLKRLLGLEGKG